MTNSESNVYIKSFSFNEEYSITPNSLWDYEYLTFKSKGLMGYLLSRPKNWKVYTWQLAKLYKGEDRGNGIESIISMIKELIEHEFIVYRKFRGDRGQWQHEYIVYPMPIKDFQKMFPERVKADLVEPDVAKPSILTSTELTNTKQQRQHEEVVEVVSSEEKQVAKNAHVFSKEFASVRSPDWVIPEKLFLSLFAQFGWQYVIDQAKYMTAQQRKAEKDLESTKKNKTPLIENPKKFLKIACEKNWADSDHKKEKK